MIFLLIYTGGIILSLIIAVYLVLFQDASILVIGSEHGSKIKSIAWAIPLSILWPFVLAAALRAVWDNK